MKEIVIENININNAFNELWNTRKKIRQDANRIISDNIELAQELTKKLVQLKEVEEIKKLAIEAYEALQVVDMISYVSGLDYYLPYSLNYDSRSDIMSRVLNDEDNEMLNGLKEIDNLIDMFKSLESQSGQWNTSWC